MRRGAAPDLALVLAAEEAARRKGNAAAERSSKLRRFYRRVAAGKVKRPKPRLSREERAELHKAAQRRRLATIAERNRQADTPIPVAWRDFEELQAFLDESYDWAVSRAVREVRHAKVRELVAARFDLLAAWAEDLYTDAATEYRKVAEKLRAARRDGWWAFDRMTRKRYMRFRDRSGLVRLDPSESRRDTARIILKYTSVALSRVAAGERLGSSVFSIPNVPRGLLAWGKAEMFRETARFFRKFPEFTGRIEIQEDPLAADLQSWNVHNNVLFLYDPKKVTRLAPELVRQSEMPLPGELAKFPTQPVRDHAPPGELSYAKAHHYWPGKQVQFRKLEAANAEAVAKAFKEGLKYAVKWVGKKQLESRARNVDRAPPADDQGYEHDGFARPDAAPTGCATRAGTPADHGGAGAPGDAGGNRGGTGEAELPGAAGVREDTDPESIFTTSHPPRRVAPPLTEWPLDALHEWHQANKGKRRVRAFGVFYNASKPEPSDDLERDGRLRFGGRVRVTPSDYYVEAARVTLIDLIHGDKSGRDFFFQPARPTGARAREGPDYAA